MKKRKIGTLFGKNVYIGPAPSGLKNGEFMVLTSKNTIQGLVVMTKSGAVSVVNDDTKKAAVSLKIMDTVLINQDGTYEITKGDYDGIDDLTIIVNEVDGESNINPVGVNSDDDNQTS